MTENSDPEKLQNAINEERDLQQTLVSELNQAISSNNKMKCCFLYRKKITSKKTLETLRKRNEVIRNFKFSTSIKMSQRIYQKSRGFEKGLKLYSSKHPELQERAQGLKFQKRMKQFCIGLFRFSSVPPQLMKDLFRELSSVKSLKHSKLILSECDQVSDKTLVVLSKGLKTHRSLESIDLSLDGEYSIPSTLETMLLQFKSLPYLRKLNLELSSYEKLSDDVIKHFVRGLSQLPSLHSLDISFHRWNDTSEDGLHCLFQGIKTLNNLQAFCFKFNGWRKSIDEATYQNLKDMLISLKKVTHLKLSFSFFREFEDLGLEYVSQALETLPQLQDVNLRLYSMDSITDEGIKHLSQSLESLTSLKSLTLDFAESDELTNMICQHLGQGLKKCALLENFSLEYNTDNSVFDQRVQLLNDSLQNLPQLKSCSLIFIHRQNFAFALENLDEGPVFPSTLTQLDLYFTWRACGGLKDLSFCCLGRGFQNLQSLKLLNLDFDHCADLYDEGLEGMASGLKNLKSLQKFYFRIVECDKVTDDGFQSLSQGIKELASLQDLYLKFEKMNISDTGFQFLTNGISNLRSLNSLKIYLDAFPNLSDLQLDSPNRVKMFPSTLKKLELTFNSCPLTDKAFEFLVRDIKSLYLLKNLEIDFYRSNITTVSNKEDIEKIFDLKPIERSTFSFYS